MKFYSLDEVIDKHIRPIGTQKRNTFEDKLHLDLLDKAIKEARLQRNIPHQQLRKLVGIQKAQISKLKNNLTDARFETVLKVFKALNAKINFSLELLNQNSPAL